MFTLACIAAIAIGTVFGYVFSWSVRNTKPSIAELGSLIATLLGGTVATTVGELSCAHSLTLYLLGLAAGFFLYMLMILFNWSYFPKSTCMSQRLPLFPFRVQHISSYSDEPASSSCKEKRIQK